MVIEYSVFPHFLDRIHITITCNVEFGMPSPVHDTNFYHLILGIFWQYWIETDIDNLYL